MQPAITGIIPFTYFGGLNKAVGSTFLRADGVIANADDFEIWKHGQRYTNLIFQKVYWKEMMTAFPGPKILDLCDPDWLSGDTDIIDIGSLADAITCSSKNLADLVKKYFTAKPVVHVPDRLNFKLFTKDRAPHTGTAKNIVWFGFVHNAHETLEVFYPVIKEYNLNLTIIADRPYTKKDAILEMDPAFISYVQSTVYDKLQDYDIVLNPRSNRAGFKYKSNNKSIISWKLGLPVAETGADLVRLLDNKERNAEVLQKRKLVDEEYNILQSAEEYREIFKDIRKRKNMN